MELCEGTEDAGVVHTPVKFTFTISILVIVTGGAVLGISCTARHASFWDIPALLVFGGLLSPKKVFLLSVSQRAIYPEFHCVHCCISNNIWSHIFCLLTPLICVTSLCHPPTTVTITSAGSAVVWGSALRWNSSYGFEQGGYLWNHCLLWCLQNKLRVFVTTFFALMHVERIEIVLFGAPWGTSKVPNKHT